MNIETDNITTTKIIEKNNVEKDIIDLENIIYPPYISSTSKIKILKKIKKVINESIIEDYDNYLNIVYFGLIYELKNSINDVLFQELNLVTSKKRCDWCVNYSYDISEIVESSLYGLYNCGKINIFTEKELADFIYKILKFNITKI
jgi:hypothetical protein